MSKEKRETDKTGNKPGTMAWWCPTYAKKITKNSNQTATENTDPHKNTTKELELKCAGAANINTDSS